MESDPRRDQQPADADDAQEQAVAPGYPRCPNCGWQNVRRSHSRSVIDSALGMFSISRFRCRSCGTRFYRFYRKSGES